MRSGLISGTGDFAWEKEEGIEDGVDSSRTSLFVVAAGAGQSPSRTRSNRANRDGQGPSQAGAADRQIRGGEARRGEREDETRGEASWTGQQEDSTEYVDSETLQYALEDARKRRRERRREDEG